MTDTTHEGPERIWATGDNRNGSQTCEPLSDAMKWSAKPKQYILKSHHDDLVQAMVAAALRNAAYVARNACLVPPDGGNPTAAEAAVCDEACTRILALIPENAQTALDRMLAAERERIAKMAEQMSEEWIDQWRKTHKSDSYLEGMSDGVADVVVAIRTGKSPDR